MEHEPQTQEGWEAWDIAEKILSQVENCFPLDVGLKMGKALGYNAAGLAELLPTVANATQKIIIENRKQKKK